MASPLAIQVDLTSLQAVSGKTALVTGASSGIGLAICDLLYESGCNVVYVAGRKRPPTKVLLENNPRTLLFNCDVSSWEAQRQIFADAIAKFGQIDVVCPNAGIGEPRDQMYELKTDAEGNLLPPETKVYDVDMKGTVYTTALGLHHMAAKGGSIVIVSSLGGYIGVDEMPNYAATKHGAVGLLRSLCRPAAKKNMWVSLLAPHIIYTPGTFFDRYVPTKESYEAARAALKPSGVNLSSAYTCALGVAHLWHLGRAASGMSVLVEDDELRSLERELCDAYPAWFCKKIESVINDAVQDAWG
ncbi:uncharacterized protein A1O5_09412 [Cladophialophora psammophila CBS 110553]|uniref:NAD(P)-binding protein n=1 Tax=Cladophialophora psammophila CBS 110553 TaxID=1182543 RepID=W9XAF0_9EURO|nr:uncharacterized protein A1O5_09412 [Cladophialophora psammophila CBS 110553]EXJ67399.1 hypothetical protein A1O5_09412 [Cladophialophora psammophila CBS 110553]